MCICAQEKSDLTMKKDLFTERLGRLLKKQPLLDY